MKDIRHYEKLKLLKLFKDLEKTVIREYKEFEDFGGTLIAPEGEEKYYHFALYRFNSIKWALLPIYDYLADLNRKYNYKHPPGRLIE